jgi:hypothetical protein
MLRAKDSTQFKEYLKNQPFSKESTTIQALILILLKNPPDYLVDLSGLMVNLK